MGPQSDVQAPHRVGGASCWPPLFILLVPFRFVLAPSGQPNNSSTSTHKGAEPSSAQVSHDSHSPTHPPTHTHSRSVTLTLNTITYAFIHSLTYSLTHSFTHSPSQSRIPSLTNSSHSHSHIMQAVARRTTANLRHMLLVGACPLCHPQFSAPRRAWKEKHAGSPLSKWSFNDHRFPAK